MKKRVLSLALILVMALSTAAGAVDVIPRKSADRELVQGHFSGILTEADGSLLVTDTFNKVIWRITREGDMTVYAGRQGVLGPYGEDLGGHNDGALAEAAFLAPWGLARLGDEILVTDAGNNAVRLISGDYITTLAGSGEAGLADGRGVKAAFANPTGIAVDDIGNIYVADTDNNVIRRLDRSGNVSTWAGGSQGSRDGALLQARFNGPTGLCWAEGALYVADSGNHRICKIADGQVTTLAGTVDRDDEDEAVQGGYLDGTAEEAKFSYPMGIAVANGTVYVADEGNSALRKLENGQVTTLLRGEGAVYPVSPRGIALEDGQLLVTDAFSGVVMTLPAEAGTAWYTDVAADAWYYDAVRYVTGQGLFQGIGDGLFGPQVTMTRGMAVTVLGRLAGIDTASYTETVFSDVAADAYYAPYVAWAAEMEIITGRGLSLEGDQPVPYFAPDAPVLRGELVTILWRYAQLASMDVGAGEDTNILSYTDGLALPEYAIPALQWACGAGIIQGRDDGSLDVRASATRAEVAAILQRFAEI